MKTFLPAFFLFLFLQAFTSVASAQVKISGNVRDENKEPLIGVNILIKNSTEGTVTDLDGHFELQVADPSATLIFSYTAMLSRKSHSADKPAWKSSCGKNRSCSTRWWLSDTVPSARATSPVQ